MPTRGQALRLFASFAARLIACGTVFSWGIFFDSFKTDFGLSKLETAAIFALVQGLTQGAGLLVPLLLPWFSIRQIMLAGGSLAAVSVAVGSFSRRYAIFALTFGLGQGLGQGLVFVTTPLAASVLLPASSSQVAMSLQNSGDGFGMLLFPLLLDALLQTFHWRHTLLVVAGVMLNVLVCAAALDVPPLATEQPARLTKKRAPAAASASVAILLTSALLDSLAYSAYYTFVCAFVRAVAADDDAALQTLVLSASGAASIVGRLSVAFCDNRRVPRWSVFAGAHVLQGVVMLLMVSVAPPTRLGLTLCGCFVGVGAGVSTALLCLVCADVCGHDRLAHSYGVSMFAHGIGSTAGPLVAGLISDATGSTRAPIVGSGLAFLCSSALLALFAWTLPRQRSHKPKLWTTFTATESLLEPKLLKSQKPV